VSIWEFIYDHLVGDKSVILLVVLKSEGSSPGRQGFKMVVTEDGLTFGTIGGGIMEHKWVETAKSMLSRGDKSDILAPQYHDKKEGSNKSGMICSGMQLNLLLPISPSDIQTISQIIQQNEGVISITNSGLQVIDAFDTRFHYISETEWFYQEPILDLPIIHIIGGGHVSLALSELMKFVGFYVKVYDDRLDVPTLVNNHFADEKIIITTYDQIGKYITPTKNDFVVIMTVGYRSDKEALKQLIPFDFDYLGMMGSDYKIETLISELKNGGYSNQILNTLFSPVGIQIKSKTAQEIAVSIAAEIIQVKNKHLPSGRKYV